MTTSPYVSRWKIIVPGYGGIATPHGAATSETA